MRMVRRALRFTWRKFHWSHLIQQQEGIEFRKRWLREWTANQKAPTFQSLDAVHDSGDRASLAHTSLLNFQCFTNHRHKLSSLYRFDAACRLMCGKAAFPHSRKEDSRLCRISRPVNNVNDSRRALVSTLL